MNLSRARNRMVQQANFKRTDMVFQEGAWVYLKLQPYRQVSLKLPRSQKLSKRFYGPFCVLKCVGSVAYELELPPSARLHPVFHVSLLKPCHGSPSTQITPLPLPTDPSLFSKMPLRVLGQRRVSTAKGDCEELLVQWVHGDPTEATWETRSDLVKTYPEFDLEDKILFRECGNDTVPTGALGNDGPTSSWAGNVVERPKRHLRKPAHLDDFV